jgi:SAM-dependent methyltransferase
MATRFHPQADYPLEGLTRLPEVRQKPQERTYLNALMIEASLMRCRELVRGKLLDVGCGMKPYEKTWFAGAETYVGLDYLSERSRPDVVGSALELPFPNETYDTVVCTEVLEHVPDPLQALKEMRRVLKREGTLILTTPMYWPRHEVPYDFFRYPYDGLLTLVKESDLELVKMFNRGNAYVFLGQVLQHTIPHFIRPRPLIWICNRFFLWCDRHHHYDAVTLGWTVVAKRTS